MACFVWPVTNHHRSCVLVIPHWSFVSTCVTVIWSYKVPALCVLVGSNSLDFRMQDFQIALQSYSSSWRLSITQFFESNRRTGIVHVARDLHDLLAIFSCRLSWWNYFFRCKYLSWFFHSLDMLMIFSLWRILCSTTVFTWEIGLYKAYLKSGVCCCTCITCSLNPPCGKLQFRNPSCPYRCCSPELWADVKSGAVATIRFSCVYA